MSKNSQKENRKEFEFLSDNEEGSFSDFVEALIKLEEAEK
jgi:hypothetical protein